jgi:isocitrate dehydrogenase kinase/phosphatase
MASMTVNDVARAILDGFDKHYRLFRTTSAAAKLRFQQANWKAMRDANRQRIEMFDLRVTEAVAVLRDRFAESLTDREWPGIKQAYIALLGNHQQPELAETFFNSVACRVLDRTYYHNQYIFWRPAVSTEHITGAQPTYRSYYPAEQGLSAMIKAMMSDLDLQNRWEDLDRDIAAVIAEFSAFLPGPMQLDTDVQVQVLSSLFFRNQSAYLIGRVINGVQRIPFAVPIALNRQGHLFLDALLLHRQELGALFSLARAYFMVDMEVPSAFVAFLKSIFPDKPPAELYIALGLQKQGKTLFYRDLFEHLRHSSDRFVAAPGIRGMVMLVFTLPSFPFVFKVIRDRFEPPKNADRKQVEDQYRRVKYHDPVGRMADTLEYSDVAFPIDRFDPAMLEELEQKAGSMVERKDGRLIIRHLYIERRMTPLDIYLREADDAKLRHGLREYGNALRELAGANVFPGDLLLKNFGVTRFGRVVFYDYDEIAPLNECVFRDIPTPRDDDDEYSSEPWFFVGPHDVFPAEFPKFLFVDARTRDVFFEEHPDLCTPEFWRNTQRQLAAGEVLDVPPYPASRRFRHPHR